MPTVATPHLRALQLHFHEVIRARSGHLIDLHQVTLPKLRSPLPSQASAKWFPVPGMYGGFSYWGEQRGDQTILMSESWSRVRRGLGRAPRDHDRRQRTGGRGIRLKAHVAPFASARPINPTKGKPPTMTYSPQNLLLKAMAFAADKHRDQRRKDAGASPYINHPIALASILAFEGGIDDVNVLVAALLHDTVEDTQTTADELHVAFGPVVTAIVMEVTDDKALPKAVRKQLQVDHAPHASHEARLVKLADKIANVRDLLASPPADWSAARRADYLQWAGDVVAGLKGTHAGLEAIFLSLQAIEETV